jgi:HAD superfamily hydrolase (TIGR01509 family)
MKGLAALIARLREDGIPMALATSAPKPNVTHTLEELSLTDAFPVIVRGDEVARGKPAPDVFIEAARRLGVDPADCLVFEDAPMGIEAAQAAGMRVVALTTSFQKAHLAQLTPPPTFVCCDFEEFLRVE